MLRVEQVLTHYNIDPKIVIFD